MDAEEQSPNYQSALQDFRRVQQRAVMEQLLAALRGRSAELLSYDEVRKQLHLTSISGGHLEDIPLDAIVGSVGRYHDFTRSFLPRDFTALHRWARVKMAVSEMAGVPPIEVYRVGDAYFVLDGNHRVSVARELGASHIEAYVTEVKTRVPLSSDDQPGDLIVKAELAQFLETTDLDRLRLGADLRVTEAGKYPLLEEHIQVHRYFMGLDEQRDIGWEEAVGHWYDRVYMPLVMLIRERGLLRDFPQRTEADLYLWLSEHRTALEEELGLSIEPGAAAADLARRFSALPGRVLARLGERLLDALRPNEFESGPPPGRWREERLSSQQDNRLFPDLLVPMSGESDGWRGLEAALVIARYESSRINALHVVPSEASVDSEPVLAIREEFARRCSGAKARLTVAVGEIGREIDVRAHWSDLVTLQVAHPPSTAPFARIGSGLRTLILRCPVPILAVPGETCRFQMAVLAYDGSPKGEEALFVATYIAGRWGLPLKVVTVNERGRTDGATSIRARSYLEERGIQAEYVERDGPIGLAILDAAGEAGDSLLIMGGYGHTAVVEAVLGSTVDEILRAGLHPVLICK